MFACVDVSRHHYSLPRPQVALACRELELVQLSIESLQAPKTLTFNSALQKNCLLQLDQMHQWPKTKLLLFSTSRAIGSPLGLNRQSNQCQTSSSSIDPADDDDDPAGGHNFNIFIYIYKENMH